MRKCGYKEVIKVGNCNICLLKGRAVNEQECDKCNVSKEVMKWKEEE